MFTYWQEDKKFEWKKDFILFFPCKSFIIIIKGQSIHFSCVSFSAGVLFWIVLNTELMYAPGCLCTLLIVTENWKTEWYIYKTQNLKNTCFEKSISRLCVGFPVFLVIVVIVHCNALLQKMYCKFKSFVQEWDCLKSAYFKWLHMLVKIPPRQIKCMNTHTCTTAKRLYKRLKVCDSGWGSSCTGYITAAQLLPTSKKKTFKKGYFLSFPPLTLSQHSKSAWFLL